MRRLVPFAWVLGGAVLGTAGCFDSHGVASDGGAPSSDAPVADVIHDTPGTIHDAPDRCPRHDIDVACLLHGTGAIPPGVPFELPVYLAAPDTCYCGEEIRCTALIGPGSIELITEVCNEIACEACFGSVTGSCTLPPLAEGVYRVQVNGRTAFDLPVSSVSPIVPVTTCHSVPGPEGCAPLPVSQPIPVALACVTGAGAGPGAVRVTNRCAGCGATPGPCRSVVNGHDITLQPFEQPTSCALPCPDLCVHSEVLCHLPALEDGAYTVHVDGLEGPLPIEILGGVLVTPPPVCVGVRE